MSKIVPNNVKAEACEGKKEEKEGGGRDPCVQLGRVKRRNWGGGKLFSSGKGKRKREGRSTRREERGLKIVR